MEKKIEATITTMQIIKTDNGNNNMNKHISVLRYLVTLHQNSR